MSVSQMRSAADANKRSPLCWPADQRRTPAHERVYGQFEGSLDQVRRELLDEIDQLIFGKMARYYTARNEVIISSNYRLRGDGQIHASAKDPEDPGVAVYFKRKQKPVCFACDKYDRVWKNIRAIQKTIEAMRGIERWGSTQLLERAFTGFLALAQSTGAGWDTVLDLDSATATVEDVQGAYRRLVKVYHPDGSAPDTEKFHAIQQALRDATMQFGGNLRPTDRKTP